MAPSIYLLAVAAFAALAQADTCGEANFSPSQYNCFNGDTLCPIIQGEAYLPCGSACYSPQQYDCIDNNLEPRNTQNDDTVRFCGSQPYEVDKYYCFDSTTDPFLCPINQPSTYVRCGSSCYLPTQFSCVNGQLNSTPAVFPNSFCRHEFDNCEVELPGGGITIVSCCGGEEFACVATKCRNLTALSHGGIRRSAKLF